MNEGQKTLNQIVEELTLLTQSVHFLNYPKKYRNNLLIFISLMHKKSLFSNCILNEINGFLQTKKYYNNRSAQNLKDFYEANNQTIYNLNEDIKWISKKYNLDFKKLSDFTVDLYEETNSLHNEWVPQLRISKDNHLICDDVELFDSCENSIVFLVYPDVILKMKYNPKKPYWEYEDILSYWIFVNISLIIQTHTGLNQRNANEVSTFIVNKLSSTKLTRSSYEKASRKFLNIKAIGIYQYEYYGELYKEDLTLVRKTIKIKEDFVKRSKFKSLKKIIWTDVRLNERHFWNI